MSPAGKALNLKNPTRHEMRNAARSGQHNLGRRYAKASSSPKMITAGALSRERKKLAAMGTFGRQLAKKKVDDFNCRYEGAQRVQRRSGEARQGQKLYGAWSQTLKAWPIKFVRERKETGERKGEPSHRGVKKLRC